MNSNMLKESVGRLCGQLCWKVVAAYGSLISIELGDRRVRQLGKTQRTFECGEYSIFIECAQWRISNGREILASSLDDLREGGELHNNLLCLAGRRVCGVSLHDLYYDLSVSFGNGLALDAFFNASGDYGSNYSISIHDVSYAVESNDRVLEVRSEDH